MQAAIRMINITQVFPFVTLLTACVTRRTQQAETDVTVTVNEGVKLARCSQAVLKLPILQ